MAPRTRRLEGKGLRYGSSAELLGSDDDERETALHADDGWSRRELTRKDIDAVPILPSSNSRGGVR